GDLEVVRAGALKVLAIGSGDVKASGIRGDVEVGSIGSGDFELEDAGGNVEIGSIGSGDAELERISGTVKVGSIGSGDLEVLGAASRRLGGARAGGASNSAVPRGELPRRK